MTGRSSSSESRALRTEPFVFEFVGDGIACDPDLRAGLEAPGAAQARDRTVRNGDLDERHVAFLVGRDDARGNAAPIVERRAQLTRVLDDVLHGEDLRPPRTARDRDAASVRVVEVALALAVIAWNLHREQHDRWSECPKVAHERIA